MSLEHNPREGSKIDHLAKSKADEIKAMNIEELQAVKEFQDWTDVELTNLIDTIRTFTEIVYAVWAKQNENKEFKLNIMPFEVSDRKAA